MVRTSKLGEKQGMSLAGKRIPDDLIVGKGNGLIMLLQGGLGICKPLTAESVAKITEMPLCNVTCGDMGTSPKEVEKYLQTVLVLERRGTVFCFWMRLMSSSKSGLCQTWRGTA